MHPKYRANTKFAICGLKIVEWKLTLKKQVNFAVRSVISVLTNDRLLTVSWSLEGGMDSSKAIKMSLFPERAHSWIGVSMDCKKETKFLLKEWLAETEILNVATARLE